MFTSWPTVSPSEPLLRFFQQKGATTEADSQNSALTAYKDNELYIKEVIAAAKSVLQVFVDDILPDDNQKHMPIRVYCRILSSAAMIWKVSGFSS